MLTIYHFFEFLIQQKINLFFLYRQLLQSGAPILGLAKSIYIIKEKMMLKSVRICRFNLQKT